jgi:hypothetical protein
LISPLLFLIVLLVLTAGVAAASHVGRARQAARLQGLARQWQLRFVPDDRFDLTPHVAARLPVAGAADVVVRDIAYAPHAGGYRYLLTVEYTVGVVRGKHRRVAAAVVTESRDGPAAAPNYSPVQLAAPGQPLPAQYAELHRAHFAEAPATSGVAELAGGGRG